MKERNSGFRNESSNTKRTGLFQRITAAFPARMIRNEKRTKRGSRLIVTNKGVGVLPSTGLRLTSMRDYQFSSPPQSEWST